MLIIFSLDCCVSIVCSVNLSPLDTITTRPSLLAPWKTSSPTITTTLDANLKSAPDWEGYTLKEPGHEIDPLQLPQGVQQPVVLNLVQQKSRLGGTYAVRFPSAAHFVRNLVRASSQRCDSGYPSVTEDG